jgi:hypothetical protein
MSLIALMVFAPVQGLRDASYSPTIPTSEAAIRDEIQGISDQLMNYLNLTINPMLSGSIVDSDAAFANANIAITTANGAVTTANTASTNANNAVTAANTATTTAGNATATANTASTNANNAVTTANTASTNANGAVISVAGKCDKSYVDNLASGFTLGAIPDNSLTDTKLISTGILSTVSTHLADETRHEQYAVATGLVNAYTVTLSPIPTSYVDGMNISVKINIANTGASTINANGLGIKPIKDALGNPIRIGTLISNGIYFLIYETIYGGFILANCIQQASTLTDPLSYIS